MEYRIGLIDDANDMVDNYKKRLARSDIELIFAEGVKTFEDILNWILESKIEYFLVDYQLCNVYDFSGSQLIHYINNKIPDLPCIIFTSNTPNEELVIKNLIRDKNELEDTGEKYDKFIDDIKNGVIVFRNRRSSVLEEYKDLISKKEKGFENSEEETRFIELYRVLSSYGDVENISSELLKSSINEKMDNIIENIGKVIDKLQ